MRTKATPCGSEMTIEEAFGHYREVDFQHYRLSPHADGGKILSLIERPCSSSGRKRWWTAGDVRRRGIDADGMARHAGNALVRGSLVVVPRRTDRRGVGIRVARQQGLPAGTRWQRRGGHRVRGRDGA
jgi:hypothetical protein